MPPPTETSYQVPGLEAGVNPSVGLIIKTPLVVNPSISSPECHLTAFSYRKGYLKINKNVKYIRMDPKDI